jgi:hypothetical protein
MKKLVGLSLLFSVSLLLTVSTALGQTQATAIPGTKVRLTPPAGFAPSKQFPGFLHEESGASIMVTEMPAPYSKITEAFTKESLATQGMTWLAQRPHTISGKTGVLLHLRQSAQGTVYLKWLIAVGTEQETVLITATFPEAVKAQWSAALENAVLGAQWDAAAVVDPLAGLNFSIKDEPEMKLARRMSSALLLTKDGTLPGKPTTDPMLVIASSISEVLIGDLPQFAAARLNEITQITGATIKQQSAVTIGGLKGSEIIAEAEWKTPQAPVTVFLTMLQDGNNYFIIQGFAARTEQQKYLPIFKRIAQSFQKK